MLQPEVHTAKNNVSLRAKEPNANFDGYTHVLACAAAAAAAAAERTNHRLQTHDVANTTV
jgi:hypothetical protein